MRFHLCCHIRSRKISISAKMKLRTPTSSPLLQRKQHIIPSGQDSSDIRPSLIVRLIAGPACDHFGPRVTFAACLLLGALPTALAGTISGPAGLYVLRFFIGILGGSFVPCQVWSTGFFDKNVVGTSNALTAGWGNAGGGK